MKKLPLAPNGVFYTIQGEGLMSGQPMVFIRLAGCSVGCPECDTDYSVNERLSPAAIVQRAADVAPWGNQHRPWVWITGGEPLDHDIEPLVDELHRRDFRVALATSGKHPLTCNVGFVSVSLHDTRHTALGFGTELKIVPGLNGMRVEDVDISPLGFKAYYVQPLDGSPDSLQRCLDWVMKNPEWRITEQAHKRWGMA